jgi:hypothetical protein
MVAQHTKKCQPDIQSPGVQGQISQQRYIVGFGLAFQTLALASILNAFPNIHIHLPTMREKEREWGWNEEREREGGRE